MVTGMLATTLVPTALHLFAGCVALALPKIGGGWIAAKAATGENTLIDRIFIVGLVMISAAIPWSLLCLALIVGYHMLSLWFGPLGTHLLDLAELAAGWIPDPSP